MHVTLNNFYLPQAGGGGGGGELVDFYDEGDRVHIWGLKFRKNKHIWGQRFWGLKKKLGYKIDRKLTYLGSERAKKIIIWGLEFVVSLIV